MKRTIAAVYDDAAQARRARELLIENGLGADTHIVSHAFAPSASRSVAADKSIWESLADFLIVDADRPLYVESLRRGGHLLVAVVDEKESERAAAILELTSPVDLDERSQRWRDEGWSPEGLGAPASMRGYAPGAGPSTENVAEELRAQRQALDEQAQREAREGLVRRALVGGSVRVRCYTLEVRTR